MQYKKLTGGQKKILRARRFRNWLVGELLDGDKSMSRVRALGQANAITERKYGIKLR